LIHGTFHKNDISPINNTNYDICMLGNSHIRQYVGTTTICVRWTTFAFITDGFHISPKRNPDNVFKDDAGVSGTHSGLKLTR